MKEFPVFCKNFSFIPMVFDNAKIIPKFIEKNLKRYYAILSRYELLYKNIKNLMILL